MAVTGTALTPGGTTGWNFEKWQRTFEQATYQRQQFIPTIDEGDRPYNLLHIRKHARVSSAVLGQSSDGTGLTYVNIIGTPVTLTPVGSTVPVAWSENEDAQLDVSVDPEARGDIEQALAESTESTQLANVASLTQIMSQAGVDGPMFRQAYGRLMGNTNGVAAPGEEPQVYGIFSHTQYPNLGTIPEFNAADVRGDNESPYVKGIWMKGGGVKLLLTTVVQQDANGWHNCLYIPSAFVVAWNVRSRLKKHDVELQYRLIGYNNVGGAVKNDLRALDLRTTGSAL
jgi:hypothetical protein